MYDITRSKYTRGRVISRSIGRLQIKEISQEKKTYGLRNYVFKKVNIFHFVSLDSL